MTINSASGAKHRCSHTPVSINDYKYSAALTAVALAWALGIELSSQQQLEVDRFGLKPPSDLDLVRRDRSTPRLIHRKSTIINGILTSIIIGAGALFIQTIVYAATTHHH